MAYKDFLSILFLQIILLSSCSVDEIPVKPINTKLKSTEESILTRLPKTIKQSVGKLNYFRNYSKTSLNQFCQKQHSIKQKEIVRLLNTRDTYYLKYNFPPLGGLAHIQGWENLHKNENYTHISFGNNTMSPFLQKTQIQYQEIQKDFYEKNNENTAEEYVINKLIIHYQLAKAIVKIDFQELDSLNSEERKIVNEAYHFIFNYKREFPNLFCSSNIYLLEFKDLFQLSVNERPAKFTLEEVQKYITAIIDKIKLHE